MMAAPEASCSSRNQAVRGPMLPGSADRRTDSERHDSTSDGSNLQPVLSPVPAAIRFGIATNSFDDRSPPRPRNASSVSVIHSSWIRRLKPSAVQARSPKEEQPQPSKKEDFICTHFAKDYSSCSRRLDKSPHHTPSSSWPPIEARSKVVDAERIERKHHAPAVNPPQPVKHSVRVPSLKNTTTQSSEAGSRTGSLFVQQQDHQNQGSAVEGFVPCAQPGAFGKGILSLGRSNRSQDSEDGNKRKPRKRLGKQIGDGRNVDCCALSEEAKPHGQLQEAQIKWIHFDNSFPNVVVSSPHLPILACEVSGRGGASADADENICFAKPSKPGLPDKQKIFQTRCEEPDCKVARNEGEKYRCGLIVSTEKEPVRDGLALGYKNAGLLASPQVKQNFNLFKAAVTKPYLRNGFSMVRAPEDFRFSHYTKLETSAPMVQNIASEERGALCSRRYNPMTFENPHSSEGAPASRSPLSIRTLHEVAERSQARGDKNLGDYWNNGVNLPEDPDHGRPVNMGDSKQVFLVGDNYEEFCKQPCSTEQVFGNFNGCQPHKLENSDRKYFGSCNFGQQRLCLEARGKFSGSRISSHQLNASSQDWLEVSREQYLYPYEGASGRVDPQPFNLNSGFHRRFQAEGSSHSIHSIVLSSDLIKNEKSRKEQNMHQRWLRRWHSTEKVFPSESPAAFFGKHSRSWSSDKLVQFPSNCSTSTVHIVGSSHKDISLQHDIDLTGSGIGSNRYTEASGIHLDSGSASTPGSLLAGRNFATFRSGYTGPSIEAMAIVGKSSHKLRPKSLQGGGFSGLPYSRLRTLDCVILSGDDKDADEKKMHLINFNGSNDLQDDFGGS